jgi:hypothetical protein
VLGKALERLDLHPVMFADDGILFTNNYEDIKKLSSEELKKHGIHLSPKKKKDGRPSCGLITKPNIEFLGTTLNTQTGKVTSPKGEGWID